MLNRTIPCGTVTGSMQAVGGVAGDALLHHHAERGQGGPHISCRATPLCGGCPPGKQHLTAGGISATAIFRIHLKTQCFWMVDRTRAKRRSAHTSAWSVVPA